MAAFEIVLRQVVPGFYLFCAIYLGLELGGPTKLKYSIVFGGFGSAVYIVLNEPDWALGTFWFTSVFWDVIVLLFALGFGIAVFQWILDAEEIDGPIQRAKTAWEWVRNFFSD